MTTQAPERDPRVPASAFALELVRRDPTVTDPRFADAPPAEDARYETSEQAGERRFDAG
ncbi:hypothetical protein BCE75_11128 [Isoptericola sp. CG 20/1183]|uniref:Uncharacterized protein n=1 Tax=Isoptericola halotolerans TaxID=300560 RepID=A0ABX5EK87_9MICO|nr:MULTISPECIES: hypothetical protein [Isoptericola]MCK0117592.1 hypothetical protein [Isoptericola sp. S6320L]PRZ04107.1 hypothetical protein BCE75_11128 [Isoptericola sp. CG 20/1183]PRZ10068.1 hypothetical protein BCL65_101206 [Isoptericola halotolerans]